MLPHRLCTDFLPPTFLGVVSPIGTSKAPEGVESQEAVRRRVEHSGFDGGGTARREIA